MSERVVDAVAAETDSRPLDLEPLYTVVDPDALDALFRGDSAPPGHSDPHVVFYLAGCRVRVAADGAVDAAPVRGQPSAPAFDPAADSSAEVPESPD